MQLNRILLMTILASILTACAGERPENLGVHAGRLADCPDTPNCISSQAADERHYVAPLSYDGRPEAAFARLKKILQARGDAAIIAEEPGYLRAELRTRLFVDDAEFLLDAEQGLIHIRSASRLGYSDFGKNRRRMQDIRTAFISEGNM